MNLQQRVTTAADAVLQRERAVGPLELLQQLGFLHFHHVQQWRKRSPYQQLIAEMTELIQGEYPGCPRDEASAIAAHTAARGSGRVGRSAAGRALSVQAIQLAVRAWIRHQHTRYDHLLMQGTERRVAREIISNQLERVADAWTS